MQDSEMRLDGNAIAGALGEVFVDDMTTAMIECSGCGSVEAIGAEHVYMHAPGIVLRCCHCERVLLVLTHTEDRHVLSFRGSAWLEV
jgi:hypothetical protein